MDTQKESWDQVVWAVEVRHVGYTELNREVGVLRTDKQGGRLHSIQLDRGNRFS